MRYVFCRYILGLSCVFFLSGCLENHQADSADDSPVPNVSKASESLQPEAPPPAPNSVSLPAKMIVVGIVSDPADQPPMVPDMDKGYVAQPAPGVEYTEPDATPKEFKGLTN